MRTFAIVALAVSVLFNLVFVIKFGHPGKHPDKSVARFLASSAWQQLALDSSLLGSIFALDLSPWVALGALVFGDVTAGWRLYLTLQAKGHDHGEV